MSAVDTTTFSGTWSLDPIHSTAAFAVKYMGVTSFKSQFDEITGTLVASEDGTATLTGEVTVDSIDIDNPQFKGHVMSADFFSTEEFPTITFTSSSFAKAGDEATIAGDLTIKGSTQRVEAKGEISEPTEDAMGNMRIGVSVETKIDRTAFGLDWNAPLPKGGNALANEVKLSLELAFVKAS